MVEPQTKKSFCVLLLEGLYIFRPTVLRLRQTILDLRMANERIVHAELTRKKAERLLALNEALSSRYQQEPQARIVELGHQVRDRDDSYYDVYQREQDGQSQFVCSYEAYRQHEICAHSLAAAALHRVSGFPT